MRMMSRLFEELDYRPTPMGALILRRRRDLTRNVDVYEIKLGDDFLMTSLHTASEVALAEFALAPLARRKNLAVVVGGLGLGYTAKAVLDHPGVASVTVVEALDAVIDWHRERLLPLGDAIIADPRCRTQHGDFFALSAMPAGAFDLPDGRRRADAILVDIDHGPDNLLSQSHAPFYTLDGLAKLSGHLEVGGIFGLWANDPPDTAFIELLGEVFMEPQAKIVNFENTAGDGEAACTVYLARKDAE